MRPHPTLRLTTGPQEYDTHIITIDMKKRFLLLFIFAAGLCAACSKSHEEPAEEPAPEVTLFDKEKEPVAYIDYADRDSTIYLWEGTPVAYFVKGKEIYHFNGQFLGWYTDGVLYDREGYAVAAKKAVQRGEIIMNPTSVESIKGVKHVKPVPHVRSLPPVTPIFKDEWSATTLTDFLTKSQDR